MKKLSELTMNELMAIQGIGIDADNFLRNNELYIRHIKPAIDHEREVAKANGDWNPSKVCDAVTISLFNSFNSGIRVGINKIDGVCAGIINRGVDAGNEIERRRKNEKQRAH